MDVINRYRERREQRLRERKVRKDANYRLPFGLCQREGIEIGKDWSPSDAWEALSKKGITPDGAYSKAEKSYAGPNDDVKRVHAEKSLNSFDEYRRQRAEKSFINKLTQNEKQEVADMLTEVFDKGAYRVTRSPESLGVIIENGYRSQIETGKSGEGAALDKENRKKLSDDMYGHGGVDDSEYEKYGYLGYADESDDHNDIGKPEYGSVTYTLKKDNLKDRTTYTFGDSANTKNVISTPGYGGEKPTIEGMTSLGDEDAVRNVLKAYDGYKKGEYDYNEMFRRAKRDADNMYIELQFHGPITVDDIERVTFNTKGDMIKAFTGMSNRSREKVLKTLRDKNVEVLYRENESEPFQNGLDWLDDIFG